MSTDKPGGWVDGIGWVANELDVPAGSTCGNGGIEWVVDDDYRDRLVVVVTRWADGSTPESPERLPDVTELPEWRELLDRHADLVNNRVLARRAAVGTAAVWRDRLAYAAEALIAAVDSREEDTP